MKLKNCFQVLGIRGKPRHYPYQIHDFSLDDGRIVHYAHWRHPREESKDISSQMVDAYREILDEGDSCIDIGAHTGDSTLPIALAMNGTGWVLALEPNPYVYHVLEKNARANRDSASIETVMAAAATREGFLQFEYSDHGYCNGGRHEGISPFAHGHAFKLDVFCIDLQRELDTTYASYLPRLKFIKTDTEGHDLYVLRSILPTLRRFQPIIKAEVFKRTDLEYRRELLHLLEELGYQVYKVDAEPIQPGARISEQNLNHWAHYDIIAYPNSTN